jgi:hypothetical protein
LFTALSKFGEGCTVLVTTVREFGFDSIVHGSTGVA